MFALIIAGLFMLASNILYIVKETERAVKLRFGELVTSDIAPGLHVKVPFMHVVRKFDARVLTVDELPQRFLTQEKKFLSVDSYAKWRIFDVGKFYTATNGEERRASQLLSQRINNGLRNQFGERSMREVVSGERDTLMLELRENLDKVTREELGIEMVDVRVKRIDLPKDVSESVYARMRAEREREAREHRSKGKELAEGLRAAADREKIIIESDAYRLAEQVRGEGDAKASSIYRDAYTQDKEFYSFTRSLKAYKQVFAAPEDLLVLHPEGEFFRYLKQTDSTSP
jgi:membrane protease subunit HflC